MSLLSLGMLIFKLAHVHALINLHHMYETFQGFRDMTESQTYKRDIEPLRLAALYEGLFTMLDKKKIQSLHEDIYAFQEHF